MSTRIPSPKPGLTGVSAKSGFKGLFRGPLAVLMSALLFQLALAFPAFADPLGDALDAPTLTWTSGGNANWLSQTSVTHDGIDAGQNGDIGNSQESWVQSTVTGPGTLTYWWKVSSEGGFDYLGFYLDDTSQPGEISGEVDWVQKTQIIPAGTHTVKWRYSKDGSASEGTDSGYLDQVNFAPDGPVSTGSATAITETTATLNGSVNPTGLVTAAVFEYGTTTAYGNTVPVTLSPNNGTGYQQVTTPLSGLLPSTAYHFRIVATNSSNPAPGADATFNTISPFLYTAANGAVTITGYQGTSNDVVIPATIIGLPVTRIGDSAFSSISRLKSMTIPSSVTTIDDDAFSYCDGLTTVTIPNSVTSIGSSAFRSCESLVSVTLPGSITSISSGLFQNCTGLKSVVIPASVTGIGSSAFYGCTLLSGVSLPAGLTSIGNSAFRSCSSLTALVLPGSVTSIGSSAFSNCSGLTTLAVPASVTSIGGYAFSSCTGFLGTITLPNTITSLGDGIFSGCANLVGAVLPSGLTSIGDEFFLDCSNLTTVSIPAVVTSIGYAAFSGCSSLAGISIPASVTSIDSEAFYQCSSLLTISIPNGTATLGSSAFSGCSGLTSAALPGGLTTIPSSLFSGCVKLPAVTLPASVTSIGGAAFYNCRALTAITLPSGVTKIGSSAFSVCRSLAGIVIPNSVTDLGDSAFEGCIALTSVTLPSGLVILHESTFYGCEKLTAITLPATLTSIQASAFNGCSKLTTLVIPAGVTSIGSSAFAGCRALTSMVLPAGLTEIADYLFSNCSSLTSVTIPASVTRIGDRAFSGCSSLVTLTIPSGVSEIGESVFNFCTSLTAITVDALNVSYSSAAGVLFNKTSTTLIQYPAAKPGSYSIPGTVLSIQSSAFSGSANLSSVGIPNSVTFIGDYAFQNCRALTSVALPNSVTYLGEGAFSRCVKLASATLSTSLTEIRGVTFEYCTSLTAISLPSGITRVGGEAFSDCVKLATVTLPASLTEIGQAAFYDCSSITTITLPLSLTTIGEKAFQDCRKLTAFAIPKNVTSIGSGALSGCDSLTAITVDALNPAYQSIAGVLLNKSGTTLIQCPGAKTGSYTLPTGVIALDDSAFRYCRSITRVTVPGSVAEISQSAFGSCSTLTSVEILDGTTAIRRAAFAYCTSLVNLRLPETLQVIADGAFLGCTSLTKVIIPSSVYEIGDNAFSGTGLQKVYFKGDAPEMGNDVFEATPASFTLYVLNGSVGYETAGRNAQHLVVLNSFAAKIVIEQAPGSPLTNGSAVSSFGPSPLNTPISRTFAIKNIGHSDLTGLSISKDGSHAADFTLTALPALSIAGPSGSTTFVVTFRPTAIGVRSAAIHIASNDADEAPFNITLTGTGTVPEIAITQGTPLTDGKSTVSFGNVKLKASLVKNFTVQNLGGAPLIGLAISKVGGNTADFTFSALPTTIAPGGNATFKVTFKPTAKGTRMTALKITSNDADESPFDIALSGGGIPVKVPSLSGSLLKTASFAADSRAAPAIGYDLVDGRRYLTLIIDKSTWPGDLRAAVEVSSNLLDWTSGLNHTTVVTNSPRYLKVRDNTPVAPGAKRYIRMKPITN